MKTLKALPYVLPICALGLSVPMQGQAGDDLTAALTGGKANADVRLRYEAVDAADVANKDEASALTARVRGGYTTGDYLGFTANMEFEHVSALIDDYSPEDTTFDTVADAEVTEVNQLKLMYKGIPDTAAILGRQRVTLDNHRFVGNVGWRQDEQTFDALVLQNTSLANTTLTYGYVNRVNQINALPEVDVAAHLVNANVKNLGPGALTAYAYLLDFDAAPASSNKTIGVRYAGSADVGTKLTFAAEYAQQSSYKDGNSGIDGDYMLLEVGADAGPVTIGLGYEVLGSDTFSGFETPLATKHAFNGWADVFLNTPTAGLVDTYVSVGAKPAGMNLALVYHNFASDQGSTDYGTEIDLLAAKKFTDNYSAGVKYASFSADSVAFVDTDKAWLWGEFKF